MDRDKLKLIWSKLSGTKTIVGLGLITGYYYGKSKGYPVPDWVLQLGVAWAGVGLTHKLDKATGVLSKLLDVVSKTAQAVDKGEKK